MAQETLAAPASAEKAVTTTAKQGEVITPEDQLRMLSEQEKVIHKNLVRFETSRTEVIRALTIIRVNRWWKQRINPETGKKFTNFKDYIVAAFPEWTLSPMRALQLMADAEPQMLAEGIIAESGQTRGGENHESPAVSAVQFAKTTHKQFDGRRDAAVNRLASIEGGLPSKEVTAIWDAFAPHLSTFLGELSGFIEQQEAEAENAKAALAEEAAQAKAASK